MDLFTSEEQNLSPQGNILSNFTNVYTMEASKGKSLQDLKKELQSNLLTTYQSAATFGGKTSHENTRWETSTVGGIPPQ
jgi:hypothetical protein